MLVNPGLEAIDLTRHGPTWTPATPPPYACLGLRPPHQTIDTTAPLPSAAAHLHGLELTVQLADAAWATSTVEPITTAVHREKGVVLMLTSAINTHQTPVTRPALHRLMRADDVALGWVAYTDMHTAETATSSTTGLNPVLEPTPPTRRAGRTGVRGSWQATPAARAAA